MSLPPLAVTSGDPAGIGLDITLDAYASRERLSLPRFALYAEPFHVRERAKLLGLAVEVREIGALAEVEACFAHALPVMPVSFAKPAQPGVPDPTNGPGVIACIEHASAAVASRQASALVTNPIAKSVLYEAGFGYPGHTEFLADLAHRFCGGGPYQSVMMLAAAELKVVPLTIHVPLSAVPRLITRDHFMQTARIVFRALKEDFAIEAPVLAVAGLNPHAGEAGTIGREEEDVLRPAIDALRDEGVTVTGPHSGDTLFHEAARATYDAVIAMFHDQALIPIKTLAFDRGVNITLGLPFARTSPDHGTAFDIAGKGVANSTSFVEAVRAAYQIASIRTHGRT